jgi:hypothetical protein
MHETTTAWGKATLIDFISIPQMGEDGREFASHIELLEDDEGHTLVRFAYSTDGAVRRGPVTLRAQDLEKLRRQLQKKPKLASALAWVDPRKVTGVEMKAGRGP